jgi:hypothetical protein
VPSDAPTENPTAAPTDAPTASPTSVPTPVPTESPTASPTAAPTASPTAIPTEVPTAAPTDMPTFCPTTSFPTVAPTSFATNSPTCKSDEILYFNDFEGLSSLTGWENGLLTDDLNCTGFSKFLGVYGLDNNANFPKLLLNSIPTDVLHVLLEFDFYEIDSWDFADNDRVNIQINNEPNITIGPFEKFSLDCNSTIVSGDINGIVRALAPPVDQCFAFWPDQKHHVSLTLPSRLFTTDGTLAVKLMPITNQPISDESAGFDNFKITAHWQC